MAQHQIRTFARTEHQIKKWLSELVSDCGRETYTLRDTFRLAITMTKYYFDTHNSVYSIDDFARTLASAEFFDEHGNALSNGVSVAINDGRHACLLRIVVLAQGINEVIYEAQGLRRDPYQLNSIRPDDLWLDERSPTAVKRLAQATGLDYNEESWGCPIPRAVA